MRTLAIGDIHGCLTALQILLDCLALQPEDRLIFLGDYIDRGPDSRGVLEKLIELSTNPQHVFLRGNHDDWLLRARVQSGWLSSWLDVGGAQTLESYGATILDSSNLALIPVNHWAFLEGTDLYFQTETEIFVHASIAFYNADLSDSHSMMWRSFSDNAPHPSGKRIICGHTSQPNGLPLDRDFAVCIDTFCGGYQGWLSALDVASNQVRQANEQGETRQFLLGESP